MSFQFLYTPRCLALYSITCVFVKKTWSNGDLAEHDWHQSHTYTVDVYSQDTFAFARITVYRLKQSFVHLFRHSRTPNNIREMREYFFTSRHRSHTWQKNVFGSPRAVELIPKQKSKKKSSTINCDTSWLAMCDTSLNWRKITRELKWRHNCGRRNWRKIARELAWRYYHPSNAFRCPDAG